MHYNYKYLKSGEKKKTKVHLFPGDQETNIDRQFLILTMLYKLGTVEHFDLYKVA